MEKFVNIYHEFFKVESFMTTYLIHREMSPLRHADKQTKIFFSQIFQNPWIRRKKNTCQKNYWAVRTPPLYFDKMSKKRKERKKERKNSKQNLWILIDMKKTKTCSKTRKKQATMIHNCVANKFFCILFSF